MPEKRRIQLTFAMSSPEQKRAWELLQAIPKGRRTKEICRLICGGSDNTVTLGEIRAVIREELQNVSVLKTEEVKKDADETEEGEIGDGCLDFMSALNGGVESD